MTAARYAEIAGAGIAGLAVATALAQRGWTVRVHERFPEVREIGAGIALAATASRPSQALRALDDAVADGHAIRSWTIVDQWGRTVQRGDVEERSMYTVSRQSLQRSLLDSARREGVEVAVDSPAAGAEDGALVLEDGSRHPGELVVGADGVGSRVRRSLQERGLRSRRIDLDVASLRYVIPRIPGDPVTEMPEWLHGNRRVGLLPLAGGRIAMYMYCPGRDEPYVDYVQTWSRRYRRMVSEWPGWGLRLRSVTFGALGRSARLNSRFAGVDLLY